MSRVLLSLLLVVTLACATASASQSDLADNGDLYVTFNGESGISNIASYSMKGEFLGPVLQPPRPPLRKLRALTIGPDGRVWLASATTHSIWVLSANTKNVDRLIAKFARSSNPYLSHPYAIAFLKLRGNGDNSAVLVSNQNSRVVTQYDAKSGKPLSDMAVYFDGRKSLSSLRGLAVDPTGHFVVLADVSANVIIVLNATSARHISTYTHVHKPIQILFGPSSTTSKTHQTSATNNNKKKVSMYITLKRPGGVLEVPFDEHTHKRGKSDNETIKIIDALKVKGTRWIAKAGSLRAASGIAWASEYPYLAVVDRIGRSVTIYDVTRNADSDNDGDEAIVKRRVTRVLPDEGEFVLFVPHSMTESRGIAGSAYEVVDSFSRLGSSTYWLLSAIVVGGIAYYLFRQT